MPMDTVGNCQNSGINRGCGYDGRPCGAFDFSCRNPFRSSSLSRPSRYARAYMPGEAWPWKNTWSPPPGWSGPRKKWFRPTS